MPILKTKFINKLYKLNHLKLYFRILVASNEEIKEIEKNFILQINKIQKYGIKISHLDGHFYI